MIIWKPFFRHYKQWYYIDNSTDKEKGLQSHCFCTEKNKVTETIITINNISTVGVPLKNMSISHHVNKYTTDWSKPYKSKN